MGGLSWPAEEFVSLDQPAPQVRSAVCENLYLTHDLLCSIVQPAPVFQVHCSGEILTSHPPHKTDLWSEEKLCITDTLVNQKTETYESYVKWIYFRDTFVTEEVPTNI